MEEDGEFQFRDPHAEESLREIGTMLREICPDNMGFVLLMAHWGEGGGLFFTSNIKRENVIKMMKEFIARQETVQ
jgi:hypothetical protein